VAEEALLEAAEIAEEALLEALEAAEEALLEALEATEEAPEAALEATEEAEEAPEAAAEDALAPAPPAKMVVDPTVVSKVEEPLVTVETIAEVVIAEDDSPVPLAVL